MSINRNLKYTLHIIDNTKKVCKYRSDYFLSLIETLCQFNIYTVLIKEHALLFTQFDTLILAIVPVFFLFWIIYLAGWIVFEFYHGCCRDFGIPRILVFDIA